MTTLLVIIHVISCVVLILAVLLQAGRGAEMGAAFGGASSPMFGAGSATNPLARMTTITAVAFLTSALFLAVVSAQRASVFDDTPEPLAATPQAESSSPPAMPVSPEAEPAAPVDTVQPLTIPATPSGQAQPLTIPAAPSQAAAGAEAPASAPPAAAPSDAAPPAAAAPADAAPPGAAAAPAGDSAPAENPQAQ